MSYIYVLAVGDEDGPFSGPVKIGITDNPERRLAEIRPHSPIGISFAYLRKLPTRRIALDLEQRVHRILERQNLAYEWFGIEPDKAIEVVGGIKW